MTDAFPTDLFVADLTFISAEYPPYTLLPDTGKITKTFKINPQGQSISAKGDKSGKKIAVTLAKHSSNSGYQVTYADNSGFKNSKSLWLRGNSKNKGTIKGLKSKKTYYVKARDYKSLVNRLGKFFALNTYLLHSRPLAVHFGLTNCLIMWYNSRYDKEGEYNDQCCKGRSDKGFIRQDL